MTVQELIDLLSEVENKTLHIRVGDFKVQYIEVTTNEREHFVEIFWGLTTRKFNRIAKIL